MVVLAPAPARAALSHLRRRRLVGVTLGATAARSARGEALWPRQPVRLIIGQPPGPGGGDLLARRLAPHLSATFGQPFVVENRPGAGGTIAAAEVARATDGHTLGVVLGGPTTTARAMNPDLGYDPARDFSPITLLTRTPFVLVVHPDLPAPTLDAFLNTVRVAPNRYNYASIGPGTVTHLAMEEWRARHGIVMEHAPYRGFPQATLDLLAGRVHAMFNVPSAAVEHIRAGRLRALVTTGATRLTSLPDVSCLAEHPTAGEPFFGWAGIVAPAGFPAPLAARIAAQVRAAFRDEPAANAGLLAAGNEILGTDPDALAALTTSEAERWNALIQRLGLRAAG